MNERIGVGVIGTGFMGRCHAQAWRNVRAVFDDVPTPDLVAICDSDSAAGQAAVASYGFARAETDWRRLIDDSAIGAISITTPNALHAEMAIAALQAGKHVWCEKPMALTLDQARAMGNAAAAAPGHTLLGYNYGRNPLIGTARRLIKAGEIGRVVHVRGCFDEDYMASAALPWSWRCRAADAGLGALGDLACHLVATLHALVGPIARVRGDMETVHRLRPMPGDPSANGAVENEDVGQALVRFANDATGVLATSRVAWGRKNHLAWEVHGTRGTLAFDQERMNELRLFTPDGPAETQGFRTILMGTAHPSFARFVPATGHGLGFNELKVIEAAEFLHAIVGGSPASPSFAEGFVVEQVIHAIAASAATGEWTATAGEGH